MIINKTKKKGRPAFPYSDNLADEICEAIASSSKGLDPLCKANPHWPSRETIYQWLANNIAFSDKYARAKSRQAEVLVDEIIAISDDSSRDTLTNELGVTVSNNAAITRDKLRIDSRKWLAAKLLPRLYGNKDDASVNLKFPSDIKNADSLLPMATEIFRALGSQEITPVQAKILLGTIKDYGNAITIIDLNQRLSQLLENETL